MKATAVVLLLVACALLGAVLHELLAVRESARLVALALDEQIKVARLIQFSVNHQREFTVKFSRGYEFPAVPVKLVENQVTIPVISALPLDVRGSVTADVSNTPTVRIIEPLEVRIK